MTDPATASASTAASATSRTVLPGIAMIAATFGLARYGYGLLLPEMQSELRISPGTAGVISSATYVSYLVANVAVVWLSARFSHRVAIGAAGATAAVGMTIVSTAHGAAVLAVGVLVAGAAAGLAFPPYAELVDRNVHPNRRELAWSAISSGTGWGVAIAGPIAIVAGSQWRLAWLVFVALTLAAASVAVLLAPARNGTARVQRPQLSWTWFLCPQSRPLLLSAVLIGAGSAVWWVFSVDALRHGGMSATWARSIYATCGVAGVIASTSGVAFARIGLRGGYLTACALLATSLVLLGIGSHGLMLALTAAVLFGVFYNAVIAAQGVWSLRVFADHPAAGLAATNTALTIGTLTGPSLAGTMIAHLGYAATLIAAGLVVAIALPLCPPTDRRRRQLAAHPCTAAPVRT